jgi:hypothetical protein
MASDIAALNLTSSVEPVYSHVFETPLSIVGEDVNKPPITVSFEVPPNDVPATLYCT